MAVMIPEKPRDFTPESREDLLFHALEALPDDYYVVHSFHINKVKKDNSLFDAEADFVVFNRNKGILCIEAKATRVKYQYGEWRYGNGMTMHSGGPFEQAKRSMYAIRDYMRDHEMQTIIDHCKFLYAVWFPLVSRDYMKTLSLPSDAAPELILTEEALYDAKPDIERIFSIAERGKTETTISETMAERIVNEILCPSFSIAPTATFGNDTKRMVFHRLLKEQAAILNYLDEQKTAVINGAAGTGKTLVAVEKAKRHALRGQKVLFLCFNTFLRNHLAESYPHENIDYYTIAGLAFHYFPGPTADYSALAKLLCDMADHHTFPYQHIVVDEGQDFGNEDIEEAEILELLKSNVEEQEDSSFFVFYDKLQLIQAQRLPTFLEEADCRLSLYRNCRNTENIAKTSLRPLTEQNPKLMEGYIIGVPAKLHFCPDEDVLLCALDSTLDELFSEGYERIVLLTCKTEENSALAPYLTEGSYLAGRKKIRFTTCRKFKGLESDAVILLDVDADTFLGKDEHNANNVLLYYVGTSRARLRLDILTTMDDADCGSVLEHMGKQSKPQRAKRDLSRALNALPVSETAD